MSKSNSSSSPPQIKCFTHHHLTAAQHGFLDVCRALAHQTGILYFDGRSISQKFQGMGKSRAYGLANELAGIGFLKLVKESKRKKDGTFSPKQYHVLSHEEWVAEHPGVCERLFQERVFPTADPDSPVQPGGMDGSPVHSADSPVHSADSPVQRADWPVQPGGHNLIYIPNTNQPPTNQLNVLPIKKPVQPGGLDKFQKRWLKRSGANEVSEAHTGQLESFSEATFDGRPVQPGGQAVSDTPAHDGSTKVVGMDWWGEPLPGCEFRRGDNAGYWRDGKRVSFDEAQRLAKEIYGSETN